MAESADIFTALRSAQALREFLETRTADEYDINAWNRAGSAPLHLAVAACGENEDSSKVSVVDLLLRQFDINVNVRDALGNTPLHVAAAVGNCDVADLLLSSGSDLFLTNMDGHVPVSYAKNPEVKVLLNERMAGYEQPSELAAEYENELHQIEEELPNDVTTLKAFIIDALRDRGILEERCYNELRNQIEEKQMALHKVHLLERAAGVHDRQTGAKFTDQLQYLQDENEQQAAAIAYLKIRVRMLENAANRQEEFFRKNIQDLAEQHQAQLEIMSRRCKEAEESFSTGQRMNELHSYELAIARAELRDLQAKETALMSAQPGDETVNAQLVASEKKLAQMEAEVASLKDKLALVQKMKEMAEAENADLNLNLNNMRKTLQENLMEKLNETRGLHEREDGASSAEIFSNELAGGSRMVKRGTPDQLVEKLTDSNSYDNSYLQAFMLTYRLFTTKEQVLHELIRIYKMSSDVTNGNRTAAQNPVRLRVCSTLKYWMENYWFDFETPLIRNTLSKFVDYMVENNETPAILLRSILKRQELGLPSEFDAPKQREGINKPKPVLPKALQKKYNSCGAGTGGTLLSASTGNVGQNSSTLTVTSSSISAPYVGLSAADISGSSLQGSTGSRDGIKDKDAKEKEKAGSSWTPFNFVKSLTSQDGGPLKFVDIDPIELARQLTLIEFDLFSSIQPFEFLSQGWMKEDRQVRAPNICRMAKWTNHVVHWVVTEVVSVKELKARIPVYERLINLASHLNALNNFNGVKEILAALQSSAVFRLKKTKDGVGQKALKVLDDLMRSTSSELNFKNLRAKVHAAEPPVIPFPGIYCSDLVFLDTCSKSTLDGGSVNFHKFQKIASYILELQVYQQTAYALEPVPEIQDYIKEFKTFDNDEAYTQSLACEARL